jgi:hypothetical protein
MHITMGSNATAEIAHRQSAARRLDLLGFYTNYEIGRRAFDRNKSAPTRRVVKCIAWNGFWRNDPQFLPWRAEPRRAGWNYTVMGRL